MEIGNKDVYEYILNFADDKTIINMILANPKTFDNEKFYDKVMRKRYPLLIEFRHNNETWKALYLRMVYILAKLQEDYQIPYIPSKGCNPEKLLSSENRYDNALFCAASGDNIPLIDYFLEKGANSINVASFFAAEKGNINTVKHLINKGANDYQDIFKYAASGGKVETMKLALSYLGGFNFNGFTGRLSLTIAISKGHIEVIKFLINNGVTIDKGNIQSAKREGKYDVAKYLKQFVQN